MDKENLVVRLGNGTKSHWAYRYENNNRLDTFLTCGANKTNGLRIISNLELTTFVEAKETCDNCRARAKEKLEKVGA